MTHFDELKSKNIDELAEWLNKYKQFDSSPWMKWFNENYCKKCPPIMCKYKDGTKEFPCTFCELEHRCRFFLKFDNVPDNKQIIKLWLESEVEKGCEINE